MIKYLKEIFSSKEQQYVRSAEEELKTYKADRVRLMRSAAMTNAAVIANEASIKALEDCLPAMRAQTGPAAKVTAVGALSTMTGKTLVPGTVIEPIAKFAFDQQQDTRSSYK